VDKEIIVDTSALIAFFVKSETHHESAQKYYLENPHNNWIILESVFDETVTWIRSKVSSRSSIQVGQILREDHRYINVSDGDDLAIWEAFCKYNDKKWRVGVKSCQIPPPIGTPLIKGGRGDRT